MKIQDLDIRKDLLEGLSKLGYEETTPVQEKALPILLSHEDAEVEAPTGTGKTLCYGLPLINALQSGVASIQGLVICPTRELAIQVEKELNKFASKIPSFKAVAVYGGQKANYQLREIKKNPQVVVATPGRLLDYLKSKRCDISKVSFLVLDECDEMLDMGFIKDINAIIGFLKAPHQTSLFSATISDDIKKVSKKYLRPDYKSVKVVRDQAHLTQIEQRYVLVSQKGKDETLVGLLSSLSFTRAFIFCRTKHKVKKLEKTLKETTLHGVTSLQGNLSQNKRDQAMEDFKSYKADIMVATDIAARGIDISDVDLVINYDPPEQDEFYLHRIGRTGRVESKGTSYTFLGKDELYLVKKYEKMSKAPINEYVVNLKGVPTMSKYLLAIEKDLKSIDQSKVNEIKAAAEEFSKIEGRTVLPIEIAACLLAKMESSETLAPQSEKHYSSIERNKERKDSRAPAGETRYFINVGDRDDMDSTALINFLSDAAKLKPDCFGDVYMKEAFSFFNVKTNCEASLDKVADKLTLDGRKLRIDKSGNRDSGSKRTYSRKGPRKFGGYHHK